MPDRHGGIAAVHQTLPIASDLRRKFVADTGLSASEQNPEEADVAMP
jgi:hypothetical protein